MPAVFCLDNNDNNEKQLASLTTTAALRQPEALRQSADETDDAAAEHPPPPHTPNGLRIRFDVRRKEKAVHPAYFFILLASHSMPS